MAASEGVTRRSFVRRSGVLVGAAALAPMLPQRILSGVGGGFWLPEATASTVLNPFDTSNFKQDGTQMVTLGAVLTLTDTSVSDFVVLYANDAAAAAGVDVDVVATFQVRSTIPVDADAGNRVAINDGQTHSAIAACVVSRSGTNDGVRGIGLLSQGATSDPASYPVFVPIDWQLAPVTIRLRRWANGDAELVEVNGVAPNPRALLAAQDTPGPTRSATTVEFGAASVEAMCTVDYSAFRSELANLDAALTITRIGALSARDGDAAAGVTFTDADPQGSLSQYTGTIDWGDGTPASKAQFASNPFGGFAAGGVHRYTRRGTYTVTVAIKDSGGASTSRSTTLVER